MQIKDVLLLLLIGGGVWLYFHFSKDNTENQVKTVQEEVAEEETAVNDEEEKREAERLAAEEAERERREAERLAAEEAERLAAEEAERLAAEEAERLAAEEAERLAAEEAERKRREAERLAAEEAERLAAEEAERLAAEEAERLAAEEAEREKREAERRTAENREKADQYAELAKEKEKLSDIRKILRSAKKENAMTEKEVTQLKKKLDNIDDLDNTIKESAKYAAEVLYIKMCVRNKSKVDEDITSLARDCYSCDGKKYRNCSTCDGSGKCGYCRGEGVVVDTYLKAASKHFKATVPYNLRRSYNYRMCRVCEGYKLCRKCKGKGKFLCEDCKGKYPVNMRELHEEYEKKIDTALDGLKERIKEISAKMKAVKPTEEVAEEEE